LRSILTIGQQLRSLSPFEPNVVEVYPQSSSAPESISVRAAAEDNNQPSTSQRIDKLNNSLNKQLFDKHANFFGQVTTSASISALAQIP